jgi:hypothetical protein
MSREQPSIRRLFDAKYTRKVFLFLYQKQEESKKSGQGFTGLSMDELTTSFLVTYGLGRVSLGMYLTDMKMLGLIAVSGLDEKPPKPRIGITEIGYKVAGVLMEESEKLRLIDEENNKIIRKMRAAEKKTNTLDDYFRIE